MSKLIFLFLFSYSFLSFASEKTQIEITTINNLKFKMSYKLLIDKNNLYFNSEKIDPVQYPALLSSLKNLTHVIPENNTNCYAGTFTHKLIKNKKISQTTGCLNSKRAEQLLFSIEKFKKAQIL